MFKNNKITEGFFKLSIHKCAIYFIFTILILYFKENGSGLIIATLLFNHKYLSSLWRKVVLLNILIKRKSLHESEILDTFDERVCSKSIAISRWKNLDFFNVYIFVCILVDFRGKGWCPYASYWKLNELNDIILISMQIDNFTRIRKTVNCITFILVQHRYHHNKNHCEILNIVHVPIN